LFIFVKKQILVRLFIIGFKSSGKTTFGSKLAKRLGMEFVDLDDYIELSDGRSVPEIYSDDGEEEFRRKEWKALKEVVKKDNIIVSTGGGVPCHCDNMTFMEKYGDVVYIKVDDETLVGRLKKASVNRPIVKGKTEDEIRNYVTELRNRCEHHYLRARYIIEDQNITVDNFLKLLMDEKK
jgi:shikimate kinase